LKATKQIFLVFGSLVLGGLIAHLRWAGSARPNLSQQLRGQVLTADNRSLALQSAHTLNSH